MFRHLTLSCVASEPGMENVGFYNMGEVTMNLHREENDRSGVVTMNRWYEHNDNHCSAAEQPSPNHYYYHRLAGYCTGGYTNWLILLIRKLVQCPTPQTLHKSQEHEAVCCSIQGVWSPLNILQFFCFITAPGPAICIAHQTDTAHFPVSRGGPH